MKITVFSDVHGDIYSLKKMIANESSDLFICLGDLVGYGPFPNECIEAAFTTCGEKNIIMGNHEHMYLTGFAHKSCSELAKLFFEASFRQYEADHRLNNLAEKIFLDDKFGGSVSFQHTLEQRHIYPNSIVDSIDENICFIGHSHIQFSKDITPYKKIINVGSLGQNRVNKNIANYVNYFTEESTVEFKSLYSDKHRLVNDMRSRGYDEKLLQYYM